MNAEKVQSDFQLVGHRILKLDLVNSFLKLEDDETIEREYEIDYNIDDTSIIQDNRLGTITLFISCRVHSGEDKEIRVEMTIEGCFYSQSLVDDEKTFKDMLSINGSASLYSIARATIVSVTSQALYGGEVLLPMINTHEFKRQKDKSEEQDNLDI